MKTAVYDTIESQLSGLLAPGDLPWESALSSLIALIKEHLPKVSWVGFYRNRGGHLWVGAYQGKLACVHLVPGRGVCQASLMSDKTVVIEDVEKFSGHVACDPSARSEIVIPVHRNGRLLGVLDLDSHELSAFDTEDAKRLESLLNQLERKALPES